MNITFHDLHPTLLTAAVLLSFVTRLLMHVQVVKLYNKVLFRHHIGTDTGHLRRQNPHLNNGQLRLIHIRDEVLFPS